MQSNNRLFKVAMVAIAIAVGNLVYGFLSPVLAQPEPACGDSCSSQAGCRNQASCKICFPNPFGVQCIHN